jgi:hypothetical protein
MEWQLFIGCFAIALASFMAGFRVAIMLSRKAVKDAQFKSKLRKIKYDDEIQYSRTSWF